MLISASLKRAGQRITSLIPYVCFQHMRLAAARKTPIPMKQKMNSPPLQTHLLKPSVLSPFPPKVNHFTEEKKDITRQKKDLPPSPQLQQPHFQATEAQYAYHQVSRLLTPSHPSIQGNSRSTEHSQTQCATTAASTSSSATTSMTSRSCVPAPSPPHPLSCHLTVRHHHRVSGRRIQRPRPAQPPRAATRWCIRGRRIKCAGCARRVLREGRGWTIG
jgi:hypothetical protein